MVLPRSNNPSRTVSPRLKLRNVIPVDQVVDLILVHVLIAANMVILLETVAKDANLVHNNLVVVHQHVSLVVS
jgi:hypothetical protein